MSISRWHRALAALLVAASLSACSQTNGGGGGSSSSANDRDLRIIVPIDLTTLNPILAQNQIEASVDGLIFSKLVSLDAHGNEIPDLAAVVPTPENGGVSKNGLTITYHLRHNVKWHDGAPFTSRDVKFTWQAIMNPRNNVVSRVGFNEVASVDTPDPYTVVVHLKRVYPPEIDFFFGESDSPVGVLPAHLLAQYSSLNEVPFDADPVGTGPYRFARWERGDRIVLDANRQYFLGAPHIARLTILIVPDQNTSTTLLQSNGADVQFEVTSAGYHALVQNPQLVGEIPNGPAYEALIFNTSRPPLNDVNVRRALVYAVDARAIMRDTEYNTVKPAVADLTPFSWAFDPALHATPYDPAKAAALLDADGWRVGAGGMREKNGRELSLQLVYGQGSQSAEDTVEEVQQMLRKVGVSVQLKSYSYVNLYESAEAGGILYSGKFDMTLYAWISGADPDNSSQWTCAAIPPAGNNVSHYCSPAMDAAQRLALSTFDRTVRKRAYARVESLLLEDAPAAFLFDAPMRYIYRPQLKNFIPNGISEGWNAQEWQL